MDIDDNTSADYLKIGITDEQHIRKKDDFYESFARIAYNCYVKERKQSLSDKPSPRLKELP